MFHNMPANSVVTRLSLCMCVCVRAEGMICWPIDINAAYSLFVQAVEYVSHIQLYFFCVLVTEYRNEVAYGPNRQKLRKNGVQCF